MNPNPNVEKMPTLDNGSTAPDVEAFSPSFAQLEKSLEEANAELAALPETEENTAAIKAIKEKIFTITEQQIAARN